MSMVTLLAAGAVTLCAQFGLIPDNTVMGAGFELGGYVFRDLGSTPGLFVNETGERGLQFKKAGVAVTLPSPVASVDLRVGAFNGPVTITGKNLSGNAIASQTVPGVNKFVDLRLVGAEIATIELTGGGDEGLLARICVALAVCGCK